ncbi:cytochrome P450 [Vararia minispora EC-137]|uniref:Cytochrome P450 n=1 Tax=Vararia minispora EC-137 TaxID=1314806 RepID=A0ACB8QSQ5_9AGAM|nr:cytochrome P450 [Vararia minispora EC-137]
MPIQSFLPSSLVATAGPILGLYFVANAFYQLLFSPLRHVPGPWYAAISEIWFVSHLVRLRQCKIIHQLFEEYGPIVRYAPGKVAYLDTPSNKRVYMNYQMAKGPQYKGFMINDSDWSMTLLPHSEHVVRKKAYASHYTAANAALFQHETYQNVFVAVDILSNIGGLSPVDCLVFFGQMIADVICAANLACDVGVLKSWGSSSGKHWLIRCIDDFPKRSFLRIVTPSWLFGMYYNIPIERWQQFLDCSKTLGEFVDRRVKEAKAQLTDGKLHDVEKLSLVQRLIQTRLPSGETMSDVDVVNECIGHLAAGVETTATMISYACWEISRRPDIAQKLREELDSYMPDPKCIPDIAVLNGLPFLSAVLKETFRVYSPGPGLLQRVVPDSKNAPEPFNLLGYTLPSGTIVATQSYSMHRDPTVFPRPYDFRPERWLEADESGLASMNQHMMAFGGGLRVCGGQHFAQQTIRATIAAIVRNFHIVSPSETNAWTMEMVDGVVAFPRGRKCRLAFHPRLHS